MNKRKLQATGGASLTLTLPKAWTSHWNLRSKDEVFVNSNGSALVIKPATAERPEVEALIEIGGMPDAWLLREMIGAFIAGADKLTLTAQRITPSQSQTVRQTVQRLFGFEIVAETSWRIVARSVLDGSRFPVSESTLRIFLIARGMFEDALKAAQTGDKELALNVKQRDFEVNKLEYAVERQFQEIVCGKVEGDLVAVSYYRRVANELERIGDHAVRIAELTNSDLTDPAKLSTTFPAVQERVQRLFREVETMVRQLDKSQAHRVLDSGEELEALIFSSRRMKLSYEGALIEASLDRLRGYLMNIAELTIDYKLAP